MKLNPFTPGSIKVGRAGGGRGGFPGGGGGKLGCGTLVLAAIGALVFGIDPMQTIGMVEGVQQSSPSGQVTSGELDEKYCYENEYATESCNALASLNQAWEPLFQQAGIAFETPALRFPATQQFNTACGSANTGMGPFYCPANQTIYIDTTFYETMARRMGAAGDFARYYVMAHEYGHHVQHMTGLAGQIRSAQQQNPRAANQLQVAMELQADCYAGVWAAKNRNLIEPGDLQEGMRAASAIGDDTLQRNAGQRVNPESFTHGSSAQRMQWLKRGLETGDDEACDTFAQYRS
ncbi:uncharacterized protein HME9302_01327 [Alteripontixanthobacter maritimus]|uniref:Zinc metalloprotease n=1 Tax=Alteripontixanthobacter maritimus TaxID=2161824 RepID=A0A369QCW9_9SPHN|nr:neutral zinc metallopeptidase [Alteripontixanthobacter maritimus]RDC60128.1 uncharacterized protein HME9302_01327 [Alteripontixanthobacter maritimus]